MGSSQANEKAEGLTAGGDKVKLCFSFSRKDDVARFLWVARGVVAAHASLKCMNEVSEESRSSGSDIESCALTLEVPRWRVNGIILLKIILLTNLIR